jgi:hypothetical protein
MGYACLGTVVRKISNMFFALAMRTLEAASFFRG